MNETCWRSKDELKSDIRYLQIFDAVKKTYQECRMIGIDSVRESENSELSVILDDDDDDDLLIN